MTAPEHLIISGPEDILGYIPHSLGYWPSQSLVAMTMQGKRLVATLRVDLPEDCGRRGREGFARTVAEYLLADKEADGTLLVFFDDGLGDGGFGDSFGDDGFFDDGREGAAALSFRPLLADLECALGLAGMPVRDAWRVGNEYWRNIYCTDSSCCPPPGRPIAEIRDSRLNAEMVYLGSSVGAPPGTPSPGATDIPAADDAVVMATESEWTLALAGKGNQRAQFDAVLDAWAAALEALSPEAVPGGGVPGGSALLAARSLPGVPDGGLEPELAGFLRASLRVPAWRDAVLVMAAAGRPAAAAGAEAFGIFSAGEGLPVSCPPLPEPQATASCPEQGQAPSNPNQPAASSCGPDALPGYGEVLLGLSPPVPDWDTLNRLEGLMVELSCGGGEAKAAALTAAGWIEWCRGKGSFAHASLTRALEASPGYRLAELLSEVVRRGTICGWAGRREAAWQKFGSDAA
ncbi:DUF4192 family protein [Arthrobacter globiformis]|uniref:DUF4192 domain-containing protein n=1 Tax=Arthrobacter globiformis TaxID=1665 RepID=A0A328HG44_ARTGO|nr:DUF4192 family protein [Arthrobacter globiformis]RAM37609.1 hypothetical protein DBZ45_08320 [Arthrobacter globiformis]